MAVIGAVLLGVLYLMALLCEFVAPYDPNWRDTDHVLLPPQVPRVRSDEGLHLRPFVFATEMTRDPVTRARPIATTAAPAMACGCCHAVSRIDCGGSSRPSGTCSASRRAA